MMADVLPAEYYSKVQDSKSTDYNGPDDRCTVQLQLTIYGSELECRHPNRSR